MMDLLSWNKTLAPGSRLYYNKYLYSYSFNLRQATALRSLNHNHIDKVIDFRQNGSYNWSRITGETITETQISNLHKICDFLLLDSRDKKILTTSNCVFIYTNDLTLIDDIYNLPFISASNTRHFSERVITWADDCIKLKKSQYLYRSFLRSVRLSEQQLTSTKQYLLAQKEIRLSPSLKSWIRSQRNSWCQDYYFFDHNSESIVQMLALVFPKLITKTKLIITDK